MPIFDTHCHYNLQPLYSGQTTDYFSSKKVGELVHQNWRDHWQKSRKNNVVASLIPGASLASSRTAIDIAQQDPNLYASIAIQPHELSKNTKAKKVNQDWQQLINLGDHEQVVAIGETGLDYYYFKNDDDKQNIINKQQQLFIKHITLANQTNKTLIIHARDKNEQAYNDILSLIKKHYHFNQPFILHCVSGPISYIQQALGLGAYLSFASNVTYQSAHHLRKLVKIAPVDKILLETDAPFLPPAAYRGQINQPFMINDTAQFIKQKCNLDLSQILANSYQAYGLDQD